MHILRNISRDKDNETMKIDELIQYNIRKVLFKNDTRNVLEKLFLDPFLKNQT